MLMHLEVLSPLSLTEAFVHQYSDINAHKWNKERTEIVFEHVANVDSLLNSMKWFFDWTEKLNKLLSTYWPVLG
ncbi:hypothetical protein F2Q69_00055296 [Brassica cretica]|uniref:Uncharacterized protein n=2 Tax=Brassica cretica TaxID=69181 RepID=A0A8S9N230_BRACR|nr:hypothetical protein F2Q69_00055296 [Brassica cretica]KAF3590637.1 hypothetical protein DY000_02024508 [Brassica cretica]